MKPSNVLRAAKLVLPGHWIQNYLVDDDGDRCGWGWVIAVSQTEEEEEAAAKYLHRAAPEMLATNCRYGSCDAYDHEFRLATNSSLVGARETSDGHVAGHWFPWFNDAEETTEADVLAAFDRAIALAEEEGQ